MSKPERALSYVDTIMQSLGQLKQGDILTMLADMALHLMLDDIRIQEEVSPGVVKERRLYSKALLPLVEALQANGVLTPGYEDAPEPEEETSMDDAMFEYLYGAAEPDDDLMFHMEDN